jgi:hypothetical protein
MRKEIVLDSTGKEIVVDNQGVSSEPLNLAIETGNNGLNYMQNMPLQVNMVNTAKSAKSGTSNLNATARRKQSAYSQRGLGNQNRRVG